MSNDNYNYNDNYNTSQLQPAPRQTQRLITLARRAKTNRPSAIHHHTTNRQTREQVSLFQVLEPKTADRKQAFGQSGQREFPLRLLDIRRIDLAASGWETFYVKRAVDDWIRDAKLNLG